MDISILYSFNDSEWNYTELMENGGIWDFAVWHNKLWWGTANDTRCILWSYYEGDYSKEQDLNEGSIFSLESYNDKLYYNYVNSTGNYLMSFTAGEENATITIEKTLDEFVISSMKSFNNKLYLGTIFTGKIYEFDGENLTLSLNSTENAIWNIKIHNNILFASSGSVPEFPENVTILNGSSKIYEFDGENWNISLDTLGGFIFDLESINEQLFITSINITNESISNSVYRFYDNNWEEDNNISNGIIFSFINYSNFLYAGGFSLEENSTAKIWKSEVSPIFINCTENWIVNYTSCNISDKKIKYYYDLNFCNTTNDLPIDNGTIENCDYCMPNWYCSLFDDICEEPTPPSILNCLAVNLSNYETCCVITNLSSDCNYSGNLSDFNLICGEIRQILIVPTYPYVEFNVSYPIEYKILINNISSNIGIVFMNLTENDNNSYFNFSWSNITQSYHLTLIFTKEGNYPFKISATYPYHHDLNGEFIVRKSFNITFCGFKTKNGDKYENNFAYLIAEFTSSKKYYNTNLEQFVTPLGFATTFKTPVFHTFYEDGCGTFKLYEPNEEYAVRLFDGVATFETTFSPPNITKTYGTNMYIGKYTFNGTDESIKVLFTEKDINQYFWLFNYTYIILIGMAFVISIFLFFVIPNRPSLSIIFGVGFISMLTLLRIVLWLYWG